MDKNQITNTRSFDSFCEKRISYILATKDRAEYLKESLPKILELKGKEDELIIIDGNSSDGTLELIESFSDQIDIFVSEPDKNAGFAQNKGLQLAKGKYIKVLTDDDIYYKDSMDKAVEIMENHPEIDILLCGGTIEFPNEGRTSTLCLEPGTNYGKSPQDIFSHTGSGCGIFKRRNVLSTIGFRSPNSFVSDGELLARAIFLGVGVKFCRINMFHHLVLPHSFTVAHKEKWENEMFLICKKYCPRFFYYKYRLNMFLRSHPSAKLFIEPLRAIYRVVFFRPRNKSKKSKENQNLNPIWDGGFS